MSYSRIGSYGLRSLVVLALGPVAFGASLTEIPIWEGYLDNGQTLYFKTTAAKALGISPDGQVVVGHADGTVNETGSNSIGFVWDVTRPNASRFIVAGGAWGFTTALGVTSRTVDGAPELVVQGMSSGFLSYARTTDLGLTWSQGYRMTSGYSGTVKTGAANTVNALGLNDLFYGIWWDDTSSDDGLKIDNISGSTYPLTRVVDGKQVPAAYKTSVQSVSGNGIAVGRRREGSSGLYSIYMGQATGTGGANWGFYKGLEPKATPDPLPYPDWPHWPADFTQQGEAWAISADGTKAFGVSPIVNGSLDLYPYRTILAPAAPAKPTQISIAQLPVYPDVSGTSRGWVYGCSPDGNWAVGHNYRGVERAVLWDTRDPDPTNWGVYDLTAYFEALGQLGSFTRLGRAYSVTVDTVNAEVVVAGQGYSQAGSRAFVARIPLSAFPLPDTGACCMIGSCSSKFAADCPDIEGQQRWTANKLCANAACPGACCTDSMTGACSDFVESATCTDGGGVFRGASSACSAGVCLASCCKTDGTCGAEPPGYCESIDGIAGALGSVCEASTCLGACCVKAGQCEEMNYGTCPAAKFKGIGTSCATEECPCSIPFADADGDGDVDQADFALFQVCIGADPLAEPACACFDAHPAGAPDGDVDTDDWSAFEACASGSGITADPACGGALP